MKERKKKCFVILISSGNTTNINLNSKHSKSKSNSNGISSFEIRTKVKSKSDCKSGIKSKTNNNSNNNRNIICNCNINNNNNKRKELSLTCLTSQSYEFTGQNDSNAFVSAKLFPDGQRSRGRDPGKVGRPVVAWVLLWPLNLDGQRLGREENSELDPVN